MDLAVQYDRMREGQMCKVHRMQYFQANSYSSAIILVRQAVVYDSMQY